jgi:hypothetical protein
LTRLQLRARALVIAAIALQTALGHAGEAPGWRFPVVTVTYVLVGAWVVLNVAGRPALLGLGMTLLALGWLLNLLPIVANGGMPVSSAAARQAGAPSGSEVVRGHLYKHRPEGGETVLAPLGDVIPVPLLGAAVSAGDVAMFVGISVTVAAGMCLPAASAAGAGVYVEP